MLVSEQAGNGPVAAALTVELSHHWVHFLWNCSRPSGFTQWFGRLHLVLSPMINIGRRATTSSKTVAKLLAFSGGDFQLCAS
jgi:hypothetical protein